MYMLQAWKFSQWCWWGFKSSGMWSCAVRWLDPNVSKQCSHSETSRTIHPTITHPRQAESPVYIPFGQTYKLVWISHKYLLLQLVHVSYYIPELLYRQAELSCSWVQENLVTASIKIAHTTAVFSTMATSALLWAFIMSQSSLVSDGGGLWISVHVKSMCHGERNSNVL